jgi:hypothetical protein
MLPGLHYQPKSWPCAPSSFSPHSDAYAAQSSCWLAFGDGDRRERGHYPDTASKLGCVAHCGAEIQNRIGGGLQMRGYTRSSPRSTSFRCCRPRAFVWRGPRLRTSPTRSKPQIIIQNCSECCNKSKSRADPKHTNCTRRSTSQSGRYVWNMLVQLNQAGS